MENINFPSFTSENTENRIKTGAGVATAVNTKIWNNTIQLEQ